MLDANRRRQQIRRAAEAEADAIFAACRADADGAPAAPRPSSAGGGHPAHTATVSPTRGAVAAAGRSRHDELYEVIYDAIECCRVARVWFSRGSAPRW